SLFGSHIRFAVLIVLGIVISGYFAWTKPKFRIPFLLLTFWFLTYTFYSQVISGLISLFGAITMLLLYSGWKYKWFRYTSTITIVLVPFLLIYVFQSLNHNLK